MQKKNKYYIGFLAISLFLVGTASTYAQGKTVPEFDDILLIHEPSGGVIQTQQKQQQSKCCQEPTCCADNLKIPASLGPSQYVLFTGKIKESSSKELEKFFREEMLPVIAKNENILGFDTYTNVVGCNDFKYVVLLKIKPNVSLSFDTVFKVFSNGRTTEEAFSTINHFAKFFESSSTSIILYRSDLSMSRRTLGYVQAIKK